jgi:hypothetical protein
MKGFINSMMICLVLVSCTKTDHSNILSGKWMQLMVVEQFINPINQNVEYDTLSNGSATVEFRNDGSYYIDGSPSGSYVLSHDTSFILKPMGTEYHIDISNDRLTTRRAGVFGEQVKIPDPSVIGFYYYANVQWVNVYYQKQ